MKKAASQRRAPAAVFVAALLLDLSFRSLYFNFDGTACAVAVELSDFKHLVHGNHLAYGVLAWLFDRAWRLLGYGGPALLPLQALDALLGAAGAAVLASLLRRSGRTERDAFLGGLALAVSSAWWFWSLEAQVYMLGALFAALAAREALSENPRPVRLGLWLAAAALGHVGHLMAAPALAWLLVKKRGRGPAARALAALAAALLACYAAAGLLAVRPASWDELRLWLLGSAALTPDRSFAWHFVSGGLSDWALMTFRIFCDHAAAAGLWRPVGFLLAALPLAAAVRGARRGGERARFWLAWLAGYAVLYLSWEPSTVVYRVSDLLGLWALALLGLEDWSPRARGAALGAWTAAAFAFNLSFTVLPAADARNNPDLLETRWTAARVPADAWVLADGRGVIYLPYFAHLKTVNLRHAPEDAALDARLDALAAAGQAVFVTGRTLDLSGRRDALARYGLEPVAESEGLSLFRARRPKASGPRRASSRRSAPARRSGS